MRAPHATLATDAGETSLAVARHLGHGVGVAQQSYIERGAGEAAQGARALRMIRGGRS
jgi:hypothetical protein